MGEKEINNNLYKKFGFRKEIDNYKVGRLIIDEHFLEDIEQIRQDFNIPRPIFLKPCMDTYIGYLLGTDRVYDDLFKGGYTHELLNEKNRELFKEAILSIIKKYELGMNFFTWIQYFILYNETLPEGIVLNFNFKKQCERDIEELFRVPKNSQEIKTYLYWIKSILGISKKGRIPSKYKKSIKSVKKAFEKMKLKERKPRIDHTMDLEIYKRKGKNIPLPGLEFEGPVINTCVNLATAFTSDDLLEKEDKKIINQVYKRQQRLKNKLKN